MLPQAIIIGMNYEQFMEDDPQLYWYYLKAYNERKEIEFKENNYMLWLNGQYTLLALTQTMNNILSKNKKEIYPKHPVGEEEKQSLSMKEKFLIMADKINNKFNKNK